MVGEGLFVASLLTLRAALRTLSRVARLEPPHLPQRDVYYLSHWFSRFYDFNLVVGEGFEPSKSVTADLQSAPFGRSGTPPDYMYLMVPAAGIELATY